MALTRRPGPLRRSLRVRLMTESGQHTPSVPAPPAGYPRAERLALTENLHGYQVADPYRWLEDPASQETKDWLAAEDELWLSHAPDLPARAVLASRIEELMAAGFVGTPVWRGERQFFLRRLPGQEHGVLLTTAPGDPERVLVDPVAIDPTGLTTLDAWQPDKEGRLLAYQLSQAGDEESVLRVLDVATGAAVDGPIGRSRYSPVAWLPGGAAFYYVRRLPPDQVPSGEEQFHRRVYLHTVGTPDESDVEIFGAGLDKTNYYGVSVSRDGRWLSISASQGTAPRNDLWLADLSGTDPSGSAPAAPALRVVQQGVDARTGVHVGRDGRLYVFTDADAPRGRLAVTDPAQPEAANWRDLISEDPAANLADFAILDGPELARPVLLVSWTRHAIGEISVHDLATGERTGMLALPGGDTGRLGTLGGISERPEGGHEAWFGYTDNTTPLMIYHYDARDGSVQVWATAPGAVQVPDVSTRQLTFTSKDGTEVRMLVISQQAGGTSPAQPRPTILYGYGGFDISMSPGLLGVGPGLGGGRRGVRDRRAARRRRGRRGLAPGRHAGAQAERVRRLPRGGGRADLRRLDHRRPAGYLRRLQRRPAGRRGRHPVAGPVRRRGLLRAAARHGPLRAVRPRPDLERRVRHRRQGGRAGLAARLLARTTTCGRAPGTRPRCSPCSTTTPGWTRCTPARCARRCSTPPRPAGRTGRSCCAGRRRWATAPAAVSRSVALSADTLAFLAFHTGLRW